MSWIPICGMKFCFPNFKSRELIRTRWKTKLTGFLRNLTLPYEYKKTLFLKFKGKAFTDCNQLTLDSEIQIIITAFNFQERLYAGWEELFLLKL